MPRKLLGFGPFGRRPATRQKALASKPGAMQMQAAQAQQVGMAQARRVAASQQKPSDTATNQRNLAMAQARQAAANQQAATKAPLKNMNPLFNRSMAKGKKMGMAKGGMIKANCGASMKPSKGKK